MTREARKGREMIGGAVAAGRRRIDLDVFNEQVLSCQREAYTLAVALLGNEQQADEVVRGAVLDAYRQRRAAPLVPASSIRVDLLRCVLRLCKRSRARHRSGPEEILDRLSGSQRLALLLVDALRLSYDEAAAVLGCSRNDVAAWLATARQSLVERAASAGGEPLLVFRVGETGTEAPATKG